MLCESRIKGFAAAQHDILVGLLTFASVVLLLVSVERMLLAYTGDAQERRATIHASGLRSFFRTKHRGRLGKREMDVGHPRRSVLLSQPCLVGRHRWATRLVPAPLPNFTPSSTSDYSTKLWPRAGEGAPQGLPRRQLLRRLRQQRRLRQRGRRPARTSQQPQRPRTGPGQRTTCGPWQRSI